MATEEVYVNMNEAAEWAAPDEHIYKNFHADSEKTVAAPSGPVPRLILSSAPSKRRAVWTVVIALLSALLLAALIFIVWTVTRENAETSQMKMRMTNLTSERDELQESNIDMKTSNHNLSAQIRLLEERIGTLDEELQDQKNRHANLRRIMETKCCPEKWVKFSTSVYLLSQNAKNWMDSKLECEELGASLVIISSQEEQTFVSGLTSQSVWIGLTDRETEGVWRWVNGDAVTTSYWRPGQPDNWREEENCGEIPDKNQMWNDRECSQEKHFICEKLISNGCNLKSNMDQWEVNNSDYADNYWQVNDSDNADDWQVNDSDNADDWQVNDSDNADDWQVNDSDNADDWQVNDSDYADDWQVNDSDYADDWQVNDSDYADDWQVNDSDYADDWQVNDSDYAE